MKAISTLDRKPGWLPSSLLLGVLLFGCGDGASPAETSRDIETSAAETIDGTDPGETGDANDALETRETDAALEIDVEEEPTYIPLVDPALWALVPDERDPFFAQRPEGNVCAPEGLLTEDGRLEIRTGLCNWPTVEQPLLAPVAATDELEIIFFFGPVLGPEAGEAAIELRFGDDIIWQKTFVTPSTGGFVPHYVTPTRAYAAGEPVTFHLHNHGANTWNLASIAILGSE